MVTLCSKAVQDLNRPLIASGWPFLAGIFGDGVISLFGYQSGGKAAKRGMNGGTG